MSGGKRHAPLGRPLSQKYELPAPTVAGSSFAVQVQHVGAALKVEVPAHLVPQAEHLFPAEGGYARVRHGCPELRILQLDPEDDARISRVVVVRYTWERFRERAKNNEEFRRSLDESLANSPGALASGYFDGLCTRATGDRPPSVQLDCELELASYSGERASMVFVVASVGDFARAARGERNDVHFVAQVEVTMSTRALADLLASWKRVEES